MSRLVLIVALAVSAFGAFGCSKSKDEPAPAQAGGSSAPSAPAQAAGDVAAKVVEVTGAVTTRGKPVAVGDALAADDVVETGADGRVVLELQHNLAHWELGPNKQQKVRDSIAWKLPRNDGNAKVVIQDMSAAGRPAERSAADTSVTAPVQAQERSAAPPAPDVGAPPPPPPPPPGGSPPSGSTAHAASRGAEAKAAPPPAVPEVESAAAAPLAPKGNKHSAADILEEREPALRGCLGAGEHVQIHVKVDAAGKATTTIDDAGSAAVKTCLMAVIAKLALPAEKASVNMRIDKSNH